MGADEVPPLRVAANTAFADWPVHERGIQVGADRVNYLDVGSGDRPPLVLLHGLGSSLTSWLTIISDLAQRRRVVALDLPGFGRSARPQWPLTAPNMAKFLADFCTELDLNTMSLVGHSMGGVLAMQFAHRYGDRVIKLGLISSCLTTVLGGLCRPLATLVREPRVLLTFCYQAGVAALPLPHAFLKYVMDRQVLRVLACAPYVHDARRLDPAALVLAFSHTGRPGNRLVIGMGRSVSLNALLDGLRQRAAIDVLIVAGDRDRLVAAGDVEFFRQRLGVTRLFVMPETGHWPTIERPAVLGAALIAWLDGE
jgi:pimeloyl-ACP methyl ester carboxylesterase